MVDFGFRNCPNRNPKFTIQIVCLPSSHAFAAAARGSGLEPSSGSTAKLLMLGMGSAMLPDADVLAFAMGIPYADMFGHRGFTHSLPFAVVWGLLLAALAYRKSIGSKGWGLIALYLIAATASHGILDAFTSGGMGVAFFAPWEEKRYFAPDLWRKIRVSPIGASRFFSARGWATFKSELLWVWLPSVCWMITVWFFKRKKGKA
ncbi:MAG: metal-dependent hydrolase [Bacteroidia bacterium]